MIKSGSSPLTETRPYFQSIESLRGIAALTVALFHISWMNPIYEMGFIRNGYLMVDVFFVVSGFVICHSYRQILTTASGVARFMWLRFGRLYPLHFTMLLVFTVFEVVKYVGEETVGLTANNPSFSHNDAQAFIANLFLVHSLGVLNDLTFNYPSWTISVEFFTYLLFALVVLYVRSRTGLIVVSVVFIGSGICLILILGDTKLTGSYDHGFFRSVAGFFVGVLTYQIFPAWRRSVGDVSKFVLQPGLFIGAGVFLSVKEVGYSDFAILPFTALLILSLTTTLEGPINDLLNLRPLAWLGRVSYSVYMVHAAVIWVLVGVLKEVLDTPFRLVGLDSDLLDPSALIGVLFLFIMLASLLVLSQVTYRWIETPFRRKSRELMDLSQFERPVVS